MKNHGHESEINNVEGKKSTYILREWLQLLLFEVLDSYCIQIVYNSYGETRCQHVEIKQYKIQEVTQDNKRTVTKHYMIICQINDIESKCSKNSEGMIHFRLEVQEW